MKHFIVQYTTKSQGTRTVTITAMSEENAVTLAKAYVSDTVGTKGARKFKVMAVSE